MRACNCGITDRQYVTWLIYMWRDSFIRLQIIFHKRATEYRSLVRKMTHKERQKESMRACNCGITDRHTYIYIYLFCRALLQKRPIIVSRHTYICRHTEDIATFVGTGWRRLIGSPRLQIIFHKRATEYRSLVRKMTHQDEAFYEYSPPCIWMSQNLLPNVTCTPLSFATFAMSSHWI